MSLPFTLYEQWKSRLLLFIFIKFVIAGKVDATVEVKIDRRPKIRRHRPDTGNQVQRKVIPLELKTGKMFTKLGELDQFTVDVSCGKLQ